MRTLVSTLLLAGAASGQVNSVHDDCSTALAVSDGVYSFDTSGSSASGVIASPLPAWVNNVTPNSACQPQSLPAEELNLDIWMRWTPAASGSYRVDTCNSATYDTKLALYTDDCPAPLPLACNDDGDPCTGFTSELLTTGLVGGTDYLLQVGAFGATSTGTGTVTITHTGGPVTLGTNYCVAGANSVSTLGARIRASGSLSVFANNLHLTAGPVAPGQPGIFYYGPQQSMAGFGDGFRCVAGPVGSVVRMFPFAMPNGVGDLHYDINNVNPVHAGQLGIAGTTWNFQAWYRDPGAGGTGFNLSDGLELALRP
jgi:hypothetical protein